MIGRYIVLNLTSDQAHFADDTCSGIDNDSVLFRFTFLINEFLKKKMTENRGQIAED